jgi:hypothetical protein
MRNEYSVINDLYGAEIAKPRPQHQSSLGLFIVLALAGMFLYESVHPVMRLQSEPPPYFLKGKAAHRATKAAYQENVARSYWNLAAGSVAERYSYGQLLPSSPPEDFTVEVGQDDATRALYWQRLRGLWNQPDIWVRSYQLDTGWINAKLDSLGKVVRDYLND